MLPSKLAGCFAQLSIQIKRWESIADGEVSVAKCLQSERVNMERRKEKAFQEQSRRWCVF